MTAGRDAVSESAGQWQIGLCRLDVGARELTGPSSPRLRRITPKAMAVLRLLAEHPGQVVSREALLSGVWPDSAPTDDVLTQAITLLRKTFAALDSSQPYIETIARGGYRLLVDVQGRTDAAVVPPVSDDVPESSVAAGATVLESAGSDEAGRRLRRHWRRRRRRGVFLALGLLLLACVAALVWMVMRQPPAAIALQDGVPAGLQRPYRLLTPGLETASEPSLSPDGSQIAYVRLRAGGGSEIVLQPVAPNATPRVLDVAPAGAHDRLPVWSPDGGHIAFARTLADGRCAVLLATLDGTQPPESLMRCDRTELLSFDFGNDAQTLFFGSSDDTPGKGAIARLDLVSRQWTVLDYPRTPGDLDHSPRLSPDGRWLVFARNPQLGQVWRMPATGGPLHPVVDQVDHVRGIAWLHDSRHVLVTRWVGMEMRLFRVDALADVPQTGQDLGVDEAMMPAVARHSPLLAFVQRRLQSRLVRGDADGLVDLLPGRGHDLLPAVSPDGGQVLFVSDRSGVPALWLGRTDGSGAPVQIPGLLPVVHQPAAWSPDGSRALVLGQDREGARHLYEIEPDSLGAVALPLVGGPALQAAYVDQSNHLLVIQLESGRPVLNLYDRSHSPWSLLASVPGVSQVRWDAVAGQVVFTRLDKPGLYGLAGDLKGGARTLYADAPLRQHYRKWSVDGRGGVWLQSSPPECPASLIHLVAAGGTLQPTQRCLPLAGGTVGSGFAGSLDGGPVLAAGPGDGGQIGVLALPGTAPGQLPDGVKSLIGK